MHIDAFDMLFSLSENENDYSYSILWA